MKEKIYKYVYEYGGEIELSESEFIEEHKLFQEQYKNYMEKISKHGSTPENLIPLYNFIDTNAKEVNRRKKERG